MSQRANNHQINPKMETIDIIKMAYGNVRSNMLRSLLTIAIIAIGIMALVGILTALDGITYALSDSFSGLGANSFEIAQKIEKGNGPHGRKIGDPISYQQATSFKKRFRVNARVALSMNCTFSATAKHKSKTTNPNISVKGIDENYLYVNGQTLAEGRIFSNTEMENASHKAIIGLDIVKQLFDGKTDQAVGKFITVSDLKYKIIGILKSKGSGMGGGGDRVVMVPLMVGKMVYGDPRRGYQVVVRGSEIQDMDNAIAEAQGLFRKVRRLRVGDDNDFEIRKADAMIAMLEENTSTLRTATISIGLITLLGAAIGLMNIMLVSVTERTKEIGINKALGARKSDIRKVFLAEALLIGQIGGLVGIFLGIIVGNIIPQKMGGHFYMPWGWLSLGVALCILVGVASGYYPAKKAANLDPIDALRYE